jgi:hypothetical protein
LAGGGIAEVERTLRELNVPHFLYQLVKEVCCTATITTQQQTTNKQTNKR